jgi:Na+/melibiose symporter-like transporter
VFVYTSTIWPLNIGQQPLLFMAPYYSEVLGLSLVSVGGWLAAGRAFDMVADVGVAYLSDRYRTPFGRRRPWVIVGLTLFIPSLWLLFVPGATVTLARYKLALFCFFLTWTMAFIPYLVHGTELAHSHAKRAAISIGQGLGNSLGLLVSFAAPLLLTAAATQEWRERVGAELTASGWSWCAKLGSMLREVTPAGVAGYGRVMLIIVLVTTVITPILLLAYAVFIPDASVGLRRERASALAAFRNPVFVRFGAGFVLVISAYFGTLYLLPFQLLYRFHQPGLLLELSLVMAFVQVAVAPLWYYLLAHFERKNCVAAAGVIQGSAMLLFILIPVDNVSALFAAYVAFGLTGQTIFMAPFLIAADSADYSRWKTRLDSRAVHISLVSLLIKAGNGAGSALVALIGLAGVVPARAVQTPQALLALQGISLWLPCALTFVGSAIMATHPVTRNRLRALQRRIRLRAGAGVPADADRAIEG